MKKQLTDYSNKILCNKNCMKIVDEVIEMTIA